MCELCNEISIEDIQETNSWESFVEKWDVSEADTIDMVDLAELEEIEKPKAFPDFIIDVDAGYNMVYKIEEIGLFRKVYTKREPVATEEEQTRIITDKEKFMELEDFIYYESLVDYSYVGDEEFFNFLRKHEIEYAYSWDKHYSANIGFSAKEKKWYGWSHRAIFGFTIGDEVKEGDITATCGFTDEYAIQHPDECHNLPVGFKARSLQDAKRMAIAFAEAVS